MTDLPVLGSMDARTFTACQVLRGRVLAKFFLGFSRMPPTALLRGKLQRTAMTDFPDA
jgi:hypothetical protein